MHVIVLKCNTMHDHGTESHGHVLFRITRGNISGNLEKSVEPNKHSLLVHCTISQLVHCTISECLSQHELKQIKLCFNSHAGCEAALRSDGRLCLQSHYLLL